MNAPAQLRTDFERVLATKTAYDANGEPDDSEYIHECARFINLHYEALSALLAVEQKPVATVRVGSMEHGPFIFKETAYGADHLPNGESKLYLAPTAPGMCWVPEEPTPQMIEEGCDARWPTNSIQVNTRQTWEAMAKFKRREFEGQG